MAFDKYIKEFPNLHIVFISVILTNFLSCQENSQIEKFKIAKSLYPLRSDTVQIILESIDYPENLPEKEYADYIYMMVRTHKINNFTIKNDTLIIEAVKFYRNNKDIKMEADALLYAGRVFSERLDISKAQDYYNQAYLLFKTLNDKFKMAVCAYEVGEQYEEISDYKNAIYWFKYSEHLFKSIDDTYYQTNSLRKVADCYLLSQKNDSAIINYNRALLDVQNDTTGLSSDIYKNMSIAYINTKEFKLAKNAIYNSIKVAPSNKLYSLQYLILADIFENINMIDSAYYCSTLSLKYALETDNLQTIHQAYEVLIGNSENEKELLNSVDNYRLYKSSSEAIYQRQKYDRLNALESLYKNEKIKSENKRLIIKVQRFILGGILILLLLLIAFYCFKRKKKLEITHMSQIIDNNVKDLSLKDEIISTYGLSMNGWLEYYKKMILLSISPQKRKYNKFLEDYNRLLYGRDEEFRFEWNTFLDIFNQVHPYYIDNLVTKFPQLTDKDRQLILMLKAGLEIPEIAILLNIKVTTIYMRNSNIRKKLNINDSGGITDCIDLQLSTIKSKYQS